MGFLVVSMILLPAGLIMVFRPGAGDAGELFGILLLVAAGLCLVTGLVFMATGKAEKKHEEDDRLHEFIVETGMRSGKKVNFTATADQVISGLESSFHRLDMPPVRAKKQDDGEWLLLAEDMTGRIQEADGRVSVIEYHLPEYKWMTERERNRTLAGLIAPTNASWYSGDIEEIIKGLKSGSEQYLMNVHYQVSMSRVDGMSIRIEVKQYAESQ